MRQKPRIRYEPQSVQGSAVFRLVFLFIALAATLVLHVWLRTLIVSEGFRLGEARKHFLDLEAEKVKLRLERERLKSPERLMSLAESLKQQGIVYKNPNPARVYYYDPDAAVTAKSNPEVPPSAAR